jgi:hypothetical protein
LLVGVSSGFSQKSTCGREAQFLSIIFELIVPPLKIEKWSSGFSHRQVVHSVVCALLRPLSDLSFEREFRRLKEEIAMIGGEKFESMARKFSFKFV